jgi:hypothetical protein
VVPFISVSPVRLVGDNGSGIDSFAAQRVAGPNGAQQLPTNAECLLGVQRVGMFQ